MRTASLATLLLPAVLAAAQPDRDESWPDDDAETRALQVNEGQLQFIAPIEDRPILHSDTRMRIDARSLQTGWVKMRQCYRNLDAVSRTDVVYAYREMSDLRVTRVERIAGVRVEPQRLELESVQQGAQLCVRATVKIFEPAANGVYRLRNGPYHRRFLDGYYPYHVSLTLQYPRRELKLVNLRPGAQDGFQVTENPGILEIDAWFEGELLIEFEFSKK